ncbi:hypothetical protein OSB04_002947 [Centaurea solstitialis]|uniref:CCHC-type domain-containing protein n=1 Tax=Centaurea solstitialis TaxID=347529 RepID=A0AA38U4E0_9ASTR|nr:hypothetical protein OSB04_002947 [Centaurea solstitialis]
MASSYPRSRQKAVMNSNIEHDPNSEIQQWYQSPRADRWEANTTARRRGKPWTDRKRKNTRTVLNLHQIRYMQTFKRSLELANLLRNWDLGGEIGDKRNRRATCYRCKEKGHFGWNCSKKAVHLPTRRNMQEKVVQGITPLQPFQQTHVDRIIINGDYLVEGTDKGTWDTIWYVNTRITRHMTPNHDLFTNLRSGYAVNQEDNRDEIAIHGVGEVEVKTDERVFSIPYVSYAPGININVLSMKQLILQGFECEIKDKDLGCVITHMRANRRNQEDDRNESTSRINTEINQDSNEVEEAIEIEGKMIFVNIKSFDD